MDLNCKSFDSIRQHDMSSRSFPLELIDDMVLVEILNYLTSQELCRMDMCCTRLRKLSEPLWEKWDSRSFMEGKKSIAWSCKERVCKYDACSVKVRQYNDKEWLKTEARMIRELFLGDEEQQRRFCCDKDGGCCEYSPYDPENIYGVEIFLWVGRPTTKASMGRSYDVLWEGFVPNTSNSLCLQYQEKNIQWKELDDLCDFLTKHGKDGTIVDKSTPGMNEKLHAVISNLHILVFCVPHDSYSPFLLMAARPPPCNGHIVQIHWDDSSYNPNYYYHDFLGLNTNSSTTRRHHACLHLWLEVSKSRRTILKELRVDKCAK